MGGRHPSSAGSADRSGGWTLVHRTFAEWWATYDSASGNEAELTPLFRDGVFRTGFEAPKQERAGGTGGVEPRPLWPAGPPAKVFVNDVLAAPPDAAWAVVRDFAGMGSWHDDITEMQMLGGCRSDEVGATSDFLFGDERSHEQLIQLCNLALVGIRGDGAGLGGAPEGRL